LRRRLVVQCILYFFCTELMTDRSLHKHTLVIVGKHTHRIESLQHFSERFRS
jgi:hypothetical protein